MKLMHAVLLYTMSINLCGAEFQQSPQPCKDHFTKLLPDVMSEILAQSGDEFEFRALSPIEQVLLGVNDLVELEPLVRKLEITSKHTQNALASTPFAARCVKRFAKDAGNWKHNCVIRALLVLRTQGARQLFNLYLKDRISFDSELESFGKSVGTLNSVVYCKGSFNSEFAFLQLQVKDYYGGWFESAYQLKTAHARWFLRKLAAEEKRLGFDLINKDDIFYKEICRSTCYLDTVEQQKNEASAHKINFLISQMPVSSAECCWWLSRARNNRLPQVVKVFLDQGIDPEWQNQNRDRTAYEEALYWWNHGVQDEATKLIIEYVEAKKQKKPLK